MIVQFNSELVVQHALNLSVLNNAIIFRLLSTDNALINLAKKFMELDVFFAILL